MKHSTYKIIVLLALGLFPGQKVFAQATENKENKREIRIDTGNIQSDISDALRVAAVELRKIDFDKMGMDIAAAMNSIDTHIGDIQIIVRDRQEPELGHQPELFETAEKSKVISKTYPVNRNDKLAINNQYGKVSVHVWTKNEIRVDVEVKAFESSERTAQELLESVKISESRQPDLISFKTTFEKTSLNFWSRIRNGREERRGVQVNYEIYMPAANALDINNRYGSTVLPDFIGPVNISSAYGSLSTGKLDNPANQVKISYGSANMDNYANGNLDVSYGSLKLRGADKVNASIKYSRAMISRLTGSGTFNLSYSSGFTIVDVDKNVKSLMINSSYSGVTLGIDENADFNFDVTVSYAGFNYNNDKINLIHDLSEQNKSRGWNPTKNYKGSMGKGSDSRIIIKSNYGAVKFL